MLKSIFPFFLSLVSAGCFILGWEVKWLFFLFFIGFTPLFYLVDKKPSFLKFLFVSYGAMLIWNFFSLIGLYQTEELLKITSLIFLNSAIACIPFIYVRYAMIHTETILFSLVFIASWLSIEYFHLHSEIGFPFLILGNLLAKNPKLIQWYEYTGVLGGSLWILVSNIIFYKAIFVKNKFYQILIFILILPAFVSIIINKIEIKDSKRYIKSQIVHTTLKCKSEKYTKSELELVQYHSNLIKESYTDSVQLVILPENAIVLLNLSLDRADYYPLLDTLVRAIDFGKTTILTGAVVRKLLARNEFAPNKNYDDRTQRNYLVYNSSLFLKDNHAAPEIQVKNKLVPFNECIPYATYAELIGTGLQPYGLNAFSPSGEQNVFDLTDIAKIGSPICYETLFGEYITGFVKKGANILVITLNEGWYNDKKIAERFLHYASLRAIETRRTILRSSNQGYSSMTDKKGNILYLRTTEGSLTVNGKLENGLTFYSKYGDLIGLVSLFTLAFILITNFKKN